MSIDCFAYNPNVDRHIYYTRMIVFFMVPLIIIAFFLLVAFLITKCKIKLMKLYSKTIISTVLYILYPSLVAIGLQLFSCYELNSTEYLLFELSIECWIEEHMKWSLGLGIPFLIFWVIGVLLFTYGAVKLNKNKPFYLERILCLQDSNKKGVDKA